MRKNLLVLASSFCSIALVVIVIGSYVIVAQTAITGEWRADTRTEKQEKGGKLHLSFDRSSGKGHQNQFGSTFEYEDFQGLTREQTQNGKVSFRLVREAGTVECEGTFTDGKGSGTFRFTPEMGYINAMRSRGFDFEKAASKHNDGVDDKLLSAALLNVTTALADDLKSVDLGPLDVEDLFKAAIFKVDSEFMAEMKATGFPNLQMEDLVKARIFKIDADYVKKVHEMGFVDKDFEGLVKFRIFKVTPEFLAELKNEGFANLSSEEVVKFRIFKIDADFIRKAKASDPNVTVEEMVQMKIGVRKMRDND
ncbi:MAG: hypothetical protein ABIO36_01100 [Pyrinomonadaceae bacterium]